MLKARQKLGKYRIERRLAEGGFATVYQAYDTIEGISVALKIPHATHMDKQALDDFRKEVRLTASLDHPNILPIKNASFIDDLFVVVYPLGEGTLDERLQRRMATRTALDYTDQILDAVAFAHQHRVIHCDIKPENFILFPNGRLRLTDFGIAKLALRTRTLTASGTGTLGFLAPEQAFGKPTFRSDVFAVGLVLYRMFAGELPEWPYEWPMVGLERLRQGMHPDFVTFLRRALEVDERKRYRDAVHMRQAYHRVKKRTVQHAARRRRRSRSRTGDQHWKEVQRRQFRRRFGTQLATRARCPRCDGPLAESMGWCPWCGSHRRVYKGTTTFPGRCRRCGRGVKRDWRFCAWCYGGAIQEPSDREYPDARYTARCSNPRCKRRQLMPFMRYCPWCNTKVQRRWKIEGAHDRCRRCDWDVLPEFWRNCPWCGRRLHRT